MPPKAEKKVDTEDGQAYTKAELAAFYKGKYSKSEIESYWDSLKPEKGAAKAKAKGKAKAEPKAKAKPEPKSKAKAKAEPKNKGPNDFSITTLATSTIAGQEPGTSGLRKKTKIFMEGTYLHNFVQSVFNTLKEEGVPIANGILVVSGDGRYWNPDAIQIIIKIAFANGVKTVWCGQRGLLSTPATSAVIRCRGALEDPEAEKKRLKPFGGFICSASHNPGGKTEDFGIKYNSENGGPAPEKLTKKMVEWTGKITDILICDKLPDVNLNKNGITNFGNGKTVEVFDAVEDHNNLLKKCFDYEQIKKLLAREDFTITYDCMSGVQGPYAIGIIEQELGAPKGSVKNGKPKPDFGGPKSAWHGHADPNLTYAVELVKSMGLNKEGNKIEVEGKIPTLGVAADGDADRNMILGSQFFISPSDSLAMIVANSDLIPQFKDGLKGCARSMPTSGALDLVAKKKGIPFFEVPTGWKFFGNIMDSGVPQYYPGKPTYTPFICGEESFGTGADHVREKDGMWACLAWLQILAAKTEKSGELYTCEKVANEHWKEYGRNYYARYDFDVPDAGVAKGWMTKMQDAAGSLKGKTYDGGLKVEDNIVFNYDDPIDGSVSKNQGIIIKLEGGSRIIFRLSGTGSSGATIRMYLEKYEPPTGDLNKHQFEVVKPLADLGIQLATLKETFDKDVPDVIT
jgi:phosphoglucomutase